MNLNQKRQRAAKLNDPNQSVEKHTEEDSISEDDLDDLDYSGVVSKHAESDEESRKQREKLAKGIGSSSSEFNPDWGEIFKSDSPDDPDLEYSYEGITKSRATTEREKDAEAIGDAVADSLEQRGLVEKDTNQEKIDADEADEEATDSAADQDTEDAVEKTETTLDLLSDMQNSLEGLSRAKKIQDLADMYVEDGGDRGDSLLDLLEWYNETSPTDEQIKFENGEVWKASA